MRKIEIDAKRLETKADTYAYMKELFTLPSYYAKNLDSLYDCLSEYEEEVTVVFHLETLRAICENDYAFRVLMVMGKVADNNPNFHIAFRK